MHARLRPEGQALRAALEVEPGIIGILSVIALNPGVSQNDLASSVVLKKSAVTGVVKAMEAGGLVDRRRQASDRRLNALTLTAAGQALMARTRTLTEEANVRLLQDIPQADRAVFFCVMGQLVDRLERRPEGQIDPVIRPVPVRRRCRGT